MLTTEPQGPCLLRILPSYSLWAGCQGLGFGLGCGDCGGQAKHCEKTIFRDLKNVFPIFVWGSCFDSVSVPSASASAASSFTHIFVTHHLSHINFVTHHLSHTSLSHIIFHTIFHTQLCHTPLCHTPSFTHNFVTHHLSHTTLSHTIFHTTLSHTIFHTPSLTHHLSHTFVLRGRRRTW